MAVLDLINYILDSIMNYHIPEPVLRYTFQKELKRKTNVEYRRNIELAIKDKIILGRVLNDCNLLGGYTVDIQILPSYIESYMNNTQWLLKIPYEVTSHRTIIHARNLMFTDNFLIQGGNRYVPTNGMMYSMVGPQGIPGQPLMIANRAIDHVTRHTIRQTSNLEVVGNNLILVHEVPPHKLTAKLTCILEHNNDFSDINPKTMKIIEQAAVLALKAYIYNKSVVALDQAYLENGHELSSLKSVIDGYSSAMEEYETLVKEKLKKALFANDKKRIADLIAMQLPNMF